MSIDVLSRKEVAAYTRSRTREGQRRMLVRNGIRHTLDNYDWPVVLRSAVEGGEVAASSAPAKWKPNKAA